MNASLKSPSYSTRPFLQQQQPHQRPTLDHNDHNFDDIPELDEVQSTHLLQQHRISSNSNSSNNKRDLPDVYQPPANSSNIRSNNRMRQSAATPTASVKAKPSPINLSQQTHPLLWDSLPRPSSSSSSFKYLRKSAEEDTEQFLASTLDIIRSIQERPLQGTSKVLLMGILVQLNSKITADTYQSPAFKAIIKELNTHALNILEDGDTELVISILKHCADWTKKGTADLADLYALTLNHLGCAYRRENHIDKALRCFSTALHTLTVNLIAKYLPTTYLNLSALCSQQLQHEKALNYARMALLESQRQLLERRKQSPSSLDSNPPASLSGAGTEEDHEEHEQIVKTLVISYHNIAFEEEYFNQFDQAQRNYQSAARTADEYLGESHDISTYFHQELTAFTDRYTKYKKSSSSSSTTSQAHFQVRQIRRVASTNPEGVRKQKATKKKKSHVIKDVSTPKFVDIYNTSSVQMAVENAVRNGSMRSSSNYVFPTQAQSVQQQKQLAKSTTTDLSKSSTVHPQRRLVRPSTGGSSTNKSSNSVLENLRVQRMQAQYKVESIEKLINQEITKQQVEPVGNYSNTNSAAAAQLDQQGDYRFFSSSIQDSSKTSNGISPKTMNNYRMPRPSSGVLIRSNQMNNSSSIGANNQQQSQQPQQLQQQQLYYQNNGSPNAAVFSVTPQQVMAPQTPGVVLPQQNRMGYSANPSAVKQYQMSQNSRAFQQGFEDTNNNNMVNNNNVDNQEHHTIIEAYGIELLAADRRTKVKGDLQFVALRNLGEVHVNLVDSKGRRFMHVFDVEEVTNNGFELLLEQLCEKLFENLLVDLLKGVLSVNSYDAAYSLRFSSDSSVSFMLVKSTVDSTRLKLITGKSGDRVNTNPYSYTQSASQNEQQGRQIEQQQQQQQQPQQQQQYYEQKFDRDDEEQIVDIQGDVIEENFQSHQEQEIYEDEESSESIQPIVMSQFSTSNYEIGAAAAVSTAVGTTHGAAQKYDGSSSVAASLPPMRAMNDQQMQQSSSQKASDGGMILEVEEMDTMSHLKVSEKNVATPMSAVGLSVSAVQPVSSIVSSAISIDTPIALKPKRNSTPPPKIVVSHASQLLTQQGTPVEEKIQEDGRRENKEQDADEPPIDINGENRQELEKAAILIGLKYKQRKINAQQAKMSNKSEDSKGLVAPSSSQPPVEKQQVVQKAPSVVVVEPVKVTAAAATAQLQEEEEKVVLDGPIEEYEKAANMIGTAFRNRKKNQVKANNDQSVQDQQAQQKQQQIQSEKLAAEAEVAAAAAKKTTFQEVKQQEEEEVVLDGPIEEYEKAATMIGAAFRNRKKNQKQQQQQQLQQEKEDEQQQQQQKQQALPEKYVQRNSIPKIVEPEKPKEEEKEVVVLDGPIEEYEKAASMIGTAFRNRKRNQNKNTTSEPVNTAAAVVVQSQQVPQIALAKTTSKQAEEIKSNDKSVSGNNAAAASNQQPAIVLDGPIEEYQEVANKIGAAYKLRKQRMLAEQQQQQQRQSK